MYKQSAAILALFLGSSDAVTLNKRHHKHHQHHNGLSQIQAGAIRNKAFADGYAVGESMQGNITVNGEEGQENYKFAQQNQGVRFNKKQKFDTGYAEGESMGDGFTINGEEGQERYRFAQTKAKQRFDTGYTVGEGMGDGLTINGEEGQEFYNFAQAKAKQRFDTGYTVGEGMGDGLTINGEEGQEFYNFAQAKAKQRFDTGYTVGEGMGDGLTINGEEGQEFYNFGQKGHGHKFASGFGDREEFGETIQHKGPSGMQQTTYVQTADPVSWQGNGVAFPPVPPVPGFVATATGTATNVNLKGADGKASIIDAQESEQFLDDRTEKAQTRLPYASTLIQMQDPVAWQGAGVAFPPVPPQPGFISTAVGTSGNLDLKGADGKASIIDAQESEQFLDDRTTVANTRLPYASTLLQMNSQDPVSWQGNGVAFPPVPPVPGFVATAAGTASNVDLKGADGKASIIDAQESEQFLDDRTTMANTRLPYASTLLQMESQDPVAWQGAGVAFPPVPPVPGFVGTAVATIANTDKAGADGKASIIDAQESEQFLDDRTEMANTRLPYASTLLQLESQDPVAWQGAGVPFPPVPPIPGFVPTAAATAGNLDMKGADGKESIIDAQESEQFLDDRTEMANTRLPYASTLLQMRDDDPSKMETIEHFNVPIDFRFVHISNDDGELIQMI